MDMQIKLTSEQNIKWKLCAKLIIECFAPNYVSLCMGMTTFGSWRPIQQQLPYTRLKGGHLQIVCDHLPNGSYEICEFKVLNH